MRWLSCILFVMSAFLLQSQTEIVQINDPLEGSWAGVLTHPGGYRTQYTFHLDIRKTEDGYQCWSMIRVDDIYAEMQMTGTSFGDELLILEDKEMLTHEFEPGMEWCMKRYMLRLVNDDGVLKLEGDWDGGTSFGTCLPGKVSISRRPPRV